MRFSFTLRTLLLAIFALAVVLAVFVRFFQIESRYAVAQERYKAVEASYGAGVRYSFTDVVAESFMLYEADRDRWFRSGTARSNQLERLIRFENELSAQLAVTMLLGDNKIRGGQTLDNIRSLRQRFEKGDNFNPFEPPPAHDVTPSKPKPET